MRSPSSPLVDITVSPIFLPTVPDRNPRTECGCQPVAFINSVLVTPPGLEGRPAVVATIKCPSKCNDSLSPQRIERLRILGLHQ